MKLNPESRSALITLANERGIRLEGNILKVLDPEDDAEFKKYLEESLEKDQASRRKRLEITKQVQVQNRDLQEAQEALQKALKDAQGAKESAEQDLFILQKRTQFRLMHRIVNVSLGIVISVGIAANLVYIISLFANKEVERVGTVWASIIGILLTNSFSILGTIMGVKYASEKED